MEIWDTEGILLENIDAETYVLHDLVSSDIVSPSPEVVVNTLRSDIREEIAEKLLLWPFW